MVVLAEIWTSFDRRLLYQCKRFKRQNTVMRDTRLCLRTILSIRTSDHVLILKKGYLVDRILGIGGKEKPSGDTWSFMTFSQPEVPKELID